MKLLGIVFEILRKHGTGYVLAVGLLCAATLGAFHAFSPYPLGKRATFGMALFYAVVVLAVLGVRTFWRERRGKHGAAAAVVKPVAAASPAGKKP